MSWRKWDSCISFSSMKAYLCIISFVQILGFAQLVRLPLEFKQIDPKIFDYVKQDVIVFPDATETDEDISYIKNFYGSSNFYVSTKSNIFCDGRELKITSLSKMKIKTNQSRFKFVKEPCENILITDPVLEMPNIDKHPYYYALEGNQISEIQSYAKISKPIIRFNNDSTIEYFYQDPHERRSDFNGAGFITPHQKSAYLSFHFGENGELLGDEGQNLSLLKEKFNFSISWFQGPEIYGSQPAKGTFINYKDIILRCYSQFCPIIIISYLTISDQLRIII